jgi:hypothetical protein
VHSDTGTNSHFENSFSTGDVPYPACSLPSPPKLPRNNNFSDDDDNTEEEVKKLNSELEELQKCLLNGAADLDLVMESKLTTKL